MQIKLYSHQKAMANHWLNCKKSFNLSDAGTGKTLASIEAFFLSKNRSKMLVFAPVSILQAAWADDISKYGSLKKIVIAGTKKQKIEKFNSNFADIYICSHEFCKFILENKLDISKFSHCILDECTAFKNHRSQRSKAIKNITDNIANVLLLSGTPINSTVEDLWYPTKLLDDGQRLSKHITNFRAKYRYMLNNLSFVEYRDKTNAREEVAKEIDDITIRFKLDDCVELPPQVIRDVYCDISKQCRDAYNKVRDNIGIMLKAEGGACLDALNASTKANKLLQILTGAVYNEVGEVINICKKRYELIAELANQREFVVIIYNWKHQLKEIKEALLKVKIKHTHIGGDVSFKRRSKIINDFQEGKYNSLIIHSQSCSHGITLTKATTIIWSSPVYSAERYKQVNARIHRISQTKKTEVIRIAAKNTREIDVYETLDRKTDGLIDMLRRLCK